jgi:WD40 repeat protein
LFLDPGRRPVFNADSTRLAYQTDEDRIAVWDLQKGRVALDIHLPGPVWGAPAFSCDDSWLLVPVVDQLRQLVFWDLAHNANHGTLIVSDANLYGAVAAFSPDGTKLALADNVGEVTLWYVETGEKFLTLEGSGTPDLSRQLFWVGDHRLVLASLLGTLKVWELDEETPASDQVGTGQLPGFLEVAALWAASPPAGFPAAFPLASMAAFGHEEDTAPFGYVAGFTSSPDGKWLAVTDDEHVRLIRSETEEVAVTFPCSGRRLLFRADGRQLAAFGFDGVCLWDVTAGRRIARLGFRKEDRAETLHLNEVTGVAPFGGKIAPPAGVTFPWVGFEEGGRILALRVGNESGVWDVERGVEVLRLTGDAARCYLDPRGRLFVGVRSSDPLSSYAEPIAGAKSPTIIPVPLTEGQTDGLMAVSADGRRLAANVAEGFVIPPVRAGGTNLSDVATNPRVVIWELAADKDRPTRRQELRPSRKPVAHAFHPDGRLLALGFADGVVEVWDTEAGEELFHWATPPRLFMRVQQGFSPDGQALLGCDQLSPYLWRLDLPKLRGQLAEVGLDW